MVERDATKKANGDRHGIDISFLTLTALYIPPKKPEELPRMMELHSCRVGVLGPVTWEHGDAACLQLSDLGATKSWD